jgi:hypothetical protein
MTSFHPSKGSTYVMTAICIKEENGAFGSFRAIFGGVFHFSVSSKSGSIFVHNQPHFYRALTAPKPEKLAPAPPSAAQRRFRLRCKIRA